MTNTNCCHKQIQEVDGVLSKTGFGLPPCVQEETQGAWILPGGTEAQGDLAPALQGEELARLPPESCP